MIDLDRLLRETSVARAELHAELGSTNDRAQQAAAEGGPLPLLVLAERQTAGRGRGRNRWWTGQGSLAFSLLLPPLPELSAGLACCDEKRPGEIELAPTARPRSGVAAGWAKSREELRDESGPFSLDQPQQPPRSAANCLVGLAAAVAVVEAVAGRLPGVPLGIHWPNDVFAAGRKLAGVLVEVLATGQIVVGLGINCNNSAAEAPADLQGRVATLRDLTGHEHPLSEVLLSVLVAFERLLATLRREPAAVAREAHARCLQRGQWLRVRCGAGLVEGRCLGIAPDGALLLQSPEGPKMLYSGAVLA